MEDQIQPIREAARGALDEAKEHARDVKEQVQEGARDVMHVVADKASEGATAAMSTVAQEGKALANALRSAADQAERDGARLVHGPLRRVAGLFERWTDRAEHGRPQQWFADLEAFGRREPLALFGAAAAVGFLGTRALRAGAQARSAAAPRETPRDTSAARPGSATEAESAEPVSEGQASVESFSSEGGRS